MSSPAKSMALAIAPKFTAALSICGSFGIVLKVLFNESRRTKTMHRIVLGMSICDIFASIWYFTGTWAIPAGTLSWFGDGESEKIFWAAGDEDGVSCSFAGFFNQFAVATPLYNCTLAVYYLLVVNYGWRDSRIKKIEWIFHLIPVGYALITSIFAVAADLYGHVEWTCWILPGELFDEDEELSPIQSKFRWIQWIFLFGAVWTCIIVITVVFVILYRKMKSLERAMQQYSYCSSIKSRDCSIKSRDCSDKAGYSSAGFSVAKKSERSEEMQRGLSSTFNIEPSEEMQEGKPKGQPDKSDVEKGEDGDVSYDDEKKVSETILRTVQIVSGRNEVHEVPPPPEPSERNTGKPSMASWIKSKTTSMKIGRKSTNGNTRNRQKEVVKSKRIAVQGLLYVSAFYVTWFFPTMSRITELAFGKNYFAIQFLDTFLIPLQGFFNFLIYIRPNFLKYQKENSEESRSSSFLKSIYTAIIEIKIDD